jgi:serine/threonine-protein kinase
VFRVLVGYGIVAFAVLQVIEPIMHGLNLPESTLKLVVALLGLGFPVAVVLGWAFDVKQGRIERAPPSPASGPRAARLGLLLAIGMLAAAPGVAWYLFLRKPAPAGGSAATKPSIAVLPLVNLSSDKEQEYFSDGLTEELLNLLAKVPGLHVAARTSAFAFKGKNVKMSEIGQELGVATLLEGSVRKSGDQIRITTQLINAGDGYHLWSETYDRKLTDIFAVQDEIARAVVGALKLKLLPSSGSRGGQTAIPEAHNQLLLAREFLRRGNAEDFRRAHQAARRAVELDPGYAPAWAGLSAAGGAVANEEDSAEAIIANREESCAAAEKAISLAPDIPDGFLARIACRIVTRWDWTGAGEDFHRALALAPESALVLSSYAYWFLRPTGRLQEAVAALRKWTELDPINAGAWKNLGHTLVFLGELGPARKALERSLEISPSQSSTAYYLCLSSLLEAHPAEALVSAQRSATEVFRLVGVALAQHDLGDAKESQRVLDTMIAKFAKSGSYQIAEVYAWRGEKDRAFEWLERARVERDPGLLHAKGDPTLRGLHADRRWRLLLEALHLPVE